MSDYGHEEISDEVARARRRDRQLEALKRATDLVDAEALLADAAWQ